MARNDERRLAIVDAGLRVLAREGSRGLTHRAVDREAGLPHGTCVNYLRKREDIFAAMGERIFQRLSPPPAQLAAKAAAPPSRARMVTLMKEMMSRIYAEPELQIALLEMRLEATRRPALRISLTQTLRHALELDVTFHERAKLPGGRREIILLHLAFDGLILNSITLPEVLSVKDNDAVLVDLVERLIPKAN